MFSVNSSLETDEMCSTRLGRLALHKGEGEGEGPVSARRLEHCEEVFFGSNTPHLIFLPFCKGRGDKPSTCDYPLRPLQREPA
jgi:hypothetical protein